MVYRCTVEKEGSEYVAQFPDMPNVVTCGFTHDEAIEMAKEALDGCLEVDVSQGNAIPGPSFADGHPVAVANHIVLALRLRELRGGQSQDDIARKLGLSRRSYRKLENPRKANPTVKTLEKIARAYGRELTLSI